MSNARRLLANSILVLIAIGWLTIPLHAQAPDFVTPATFPDQIPIFTIPQSPPPMCLPCVAEGIRRAQEEVARKQDAWDRENRDWFLRNGFDVSVAGRDDSTFISLQPARAPGTTVRPSMKARYNLGNQAPFTVRMGPAVLHFRGAIVEMIEGKRVKTFEDSVGNTTTSCDGAFNWLYAHSGWMTDFIPEPNRMIEGDGGGIYKSAWMKGSLTRVAVRTFVDESPDNCGRLKARYVYRYYYHAPDGKVIAFYQRPHEVPILSKFTPECGPVSVPETEPSFYWSSEQNASLDTSSKCKPIIRWADGSTEEFHAATTELSSFGEGGTFPIAEPFEPACSATAASADLRQIDRNGNITTFRFSINTAGMSVQTMTDPEGRETVLTSDVDAQGMPRLRSVDLPSIGNAPPLHYTVEWRTLEIRFDQIWPDVICTPENGTQRGCTTPIFVDLVDSVTVPDGRRYAFEYGPWGNLKRVSEPGGVVREYDYGDHTNLDYARAVVPLVSPIQTSDLCGPLFSDQTVKMQARGILRESVWPDGPDGEAFTKHYKFVQRKMALPACAFDQIGAASAGPDGCSQVWMEATEPDLSVTKTGSVTRALPVMTELPKDDRFIIPPSASRHPHGRSIGQEKWSGTKLITATYNGDMDTGELWYESDFVKVVASPLAIPAGVRLTRARTFRDGLTTTTNFVFGHSFDIDPGAGVEQRKLAVTSTCTFAGVVNDNGCSGPTTPLTRTETTYTNLSDGTFSGRNLLALPVAKRLYGPTGSSPVTESSVKYDEFPVTASGRPTGALDPTLSRTAGARRGNVTTSTQRVSGTKNISSTTRYFDTGAVESVTDPRGGTTTHVPDFSLCSRGSTLRSSMTNALEHTATTVTDCASTAVLAVITANGQGRYTQFDFLARPVETAEPGDVLTALPQTGAHAFTRAPGAPTGAGTRPGQALVSTWSEYLSFGLAGQQRVVTRTRDGSPDGLYTKTFIDGLGRTVQTRTEVDPARTGFAEIVSTTAYDGMARVAATFTPCYAPASDRITSHCGSAAIHTTYDAAGREHVITAPGNRRSTHTYGHEKDRWLKTSINPRQFTSKTFSNLLDQAVQVDVESPLCGGFCSITSTYDVAGRMLTLTDPVENTIHYTYDDLGRQLTMTDPNMGHWSYEYDDNGNLSSRTDAKGQVLTFNYDKLNRLTLKDVPPAGPSTEDVTYFYDGDGPKPREVTNGTPSIASIAPSTREIDTGAFTLNVHGSNFVTASVVHFNGTSRATTFVSAQQLQAAMLATDVQTPGTFNITVVSPPPGGGTSAGAAFTVGPRPAPTIASIAPTLRDAGSAAFTLTVNGTNFVAGSVVQFNNEDRQTTFVSAQQLTTAILASDLQTAGSYSITVVNSDGAVSSVASLVVSNPVPTISSLAPAGVPVGNAAFVLTVSGSNFVADSLVLFNGQGRQTTFVSASMLRAAIPASDVQMGGSYAVKVINPAPGGGASAETSFTVNTPPGVTLTAPASGTVFRRPANVTLTATVSSSAGVTRVEFLRDGLLIGQVTAAPWSLVWTNTPEGTFQLTARATDTNGVSSTSAAVPITITEPPQVSLHSPAYGTIYTAPALVPIRAFASDMDGITRIDLYQNGSFLASGSTVPFQFDWSNVPVGSYRLTAVATDAKGVSTTSVGLDITVQSDFLNAAEYRGQTSLPAQMTAGATFNAAVTMRNQGTSTWTAGGNFRLGSQSPQDNRTWGLSRVDVSGSVAPGAETTFRFTVTAPAIPGSYTFQWQMVQDGVGWFGTPTSSVTITVVSAADAAVPMNYARGRLGGQTGPLSQDNGALARRALDGNTDGNYAAGSVAETPLSNQPWWEVSLAAPSVINQIDLWNRTDCCPERLANFYVFVANDYPQSNDPAVVAKQSNVWSHYFSGPASAHVTIPVPGVTARHVRVQLAGQGVLSLAEVQVWNVRTAALGNPRQSSTYVAGQPPGDAFRAADGNTNGAYSGGSLSTTNLEVQPWWQAELGASSPIVQVDLWNRTDCCTERLADFYLFVSDAPFTSTSLSSTLNQAGVSAYYHPGPAGQKATIRVNRTGRYFRVQLSGAAANHLSLAEVQVSVGTLTTPPAVSLTSPSNGQVFASTAAVPLRASVTGGTGTATVHYYNGTTPIGSSSTGPSYAFDWMDVTTGDYAVKAEVVDANGDDAESSPAAIRIRPRHAAAFISQSVPATMTAGTTHPVTIVVENTGAATWTAAGKYELGSAAPQNNMTWGRSREPLLSTASIGPDGQSTFQFNVTAPATPGSYNFQWQMVRDNVEWFGQASAPLNIVVTSPLSVSVTQPAAGSIYSAPATVSLRASVTGGSGSATVQYYDGTALIGSSSTGPTYPFEWTNVPAGDYSVKARVVNAHTAAGESPAVTFSVRAKNAASFVSQTVPTAMVAGRVYPVSVTMKNKGTATWTPSARYNLGSQGPQDNTTWGSARASLAGPVEAGAQSTVAFSVTAPATPGTHAFQWRMVQDGVEWFGDLTPRTDITVVSSTPAGAVAAWKFDEDGGSTTADITGNGQTGTLKNSPSWIQGHLGTALKFASAAGQTVAVPPSARLVSLTNNFTISFWAQPYATHQVDTAGTSGGAGVSGQRYAIGPRFEANGDSGMGVSVGTNGISVYEHAANYMPALLVHSAPISGWTHIAVVYQDKQPTLYVNGNLAAVGLRSPRANVHVVPADIGGMVYGYYDGELDDVRIHDTALSAQTITAMAQEGVPSGPLRSFVNSITLGSTRGDGPGLTGLKIVVGPRPVRISSLGRLCVAGNSLAHEMRVVRVSDNATLATTSVPMSGCAAGQFKYASLAVPLALAANAEYLIVSNEMGGDRFHNWIGTVLSTTGVATIKHGIYTTDNGNTWGTAGGTGNSYVPVDFQYFTEPTEAFVTGRSLGAVRADSPGLTGMKMTVGARPVRVDALGRLCITGNKLTHDLKLIRSSDNLTVGATTVAMSGCTVGHFKYAVLPVTVTLAANTDYLVVSNEVGDDRFHDWTDTFVSTTNVAVVKHGIYTVDGGRTWGVAGGAGNTYVPVDLRYVVEPKQSLVTGQSLGALRAEPGTLLGLKISVGARPITVESLGRFCAPGNTLTNELRLIRASDNVILASVAVPMSGCLGGQFRYGPLAKQVTLAADTDYIIVSREAGDHFHDWPNTVLSTTSVATVKHGVHGINGGQSWGAGGSTGNSYGPVDFQYFRPAQ